MLQHGYRSGSVSSGFAPAQSSPTPPTKPGANAPAKAMHSAVPEMKSPSDPNAEHPPAAAMDEAVPPIKAGDNNYCFGVVVVESLLSGASGRYRPLARLVLLQHTSRRGPGISAKHVHSLEIHAPIGATYARLIDAQSKDPALNGKGPRGSLRAGLIVVHGCTRRTSPNFHLALLLVLLAILLTALLLVFILLVLLVRTAALATLLVLAPALAALLATLLTTLTLLLLVLVVCRVVVRHGEYSYVDQGPTEQDEISSEIEDFFDRNSRASPFYCC